MADDGLTGGLREGIPMHVGPVLIVLPAGFEALRSEAAAEGFGHIETLWTEWEHGTNRFTRSGEQLLATFDGTALAGVGGITVDYTALDRLRMRRFYVRPAWRGRGVGRLLAETLLAGVRPLGKDISVRAPYPQAAAFWEAMGFGAEESPDYTHILRA